MSTATPLNLNESNEGMTFLSQQTHPPAPSSSPPPHQQQQQQQQQQLPPDTNLSYSAEIPTEQKNNNNSNKQNTMDSTPLADIMSSNEVMEPMIAQDPRMIGPSVLPPVNAQAAMQQQVQQVQPQNGNGSNSGNGNGTGNGNNPMNLTDEQMQALFVGVCATIAFSRPVQDKLANFVPQFVGEDGGRSTAGMAVTGLVAAVVFYFGQRMVLNR